MTNETTYRLPLYAGVLMKPSGSQRNSAGFTAEPQFYDGRHRAPIFFGRQGISQALTWSDERAIHVTIQHQFSDPKRGRFMEIEHSVANEHISTRYEDLGRVEDGFKKLLDYLPGGRARWFVVPVTLTSHPLGNPKIYEYQAEDAICTPVRYVPELEAVQLLGTPRADVVRFKPGSLEAEFVHREIAPGEVDIRRKSPTWGNWLHNCDLERGLDFCRRRLAWLIGTELPWARRGLLDRDMEHEHKLAQAVETMISAQVTR